MVESLLPGDMSRALASQTPHPQPAHLAPLLPDSAVQLWVLDSNPYHPGWKMIDCKRKHSIPCFTNSLDSDGTERERKKWGGEKKGRKEVTFLEATRAGELSLVLFFEFCFFLRARGISCYTQGLHNPQGHQKCTCFARGKSSLATCSAERGIFFPLPLSAGILCTCRHTCLLNYWLPTRG